MLFSGFLLAFSAHLRLKGFSRQELLCDTTLILRKIVDWSHWFFTSNPPLYGSNHSTDSYLITIDSSIGFLVTI